MQPDRSGEAKRDLAPGRHSPAAALVAGYTTGRLDGNIFQGQMDAFVAKFGSDGTWIWTRAIGSDQRDQATGVAADAAGNVYLVGWTYGGLDGNLNLGGQDGFLAKYDPSGVPLGSTGGHCLHRQCPGGRGRRRRKPVRHRVDEWKHGRRQQPEHYDPDGNLVWAHQRASSTFGYDLTQAIALDGQGNVFAAGLTNGGMDGNINAGDYDACVVKYELAGTPR